jgi:hypothetical protein
MNQAMQGNERLRGSRSARRARRVVATLAVMVAGSGLMAAEAGAAEYVQNGGFDQGACSASGCNVAGWDQAFSPYGTGTAAIGPSGPICSAVVTNCLTNTSGYDSIANWARIAAGTGPQGELHVLLSQVSQTVSIPAAPARLRFFLRVPPGSPQFDDSYFTVKLGGDTVFFADRFLTGHQNYAPVTIDVSAFGGQSRVLAFSGTSSFSGTYSVSFDIDDVSISEAPVAPVVPSAITPLAQTGQRAAALARCKKKKGEKRKKCKKKALQLPV